MVDVGPDDPVAQRQAGIDRPACRRRTVFMRLLNGLNQGGESRAGFWVLGWVGLRGMGCTFLVEMRTCAHAGTDKSRSKDVTRLRPVSRSCIREVLMACLCRAIIIIVFFLRP